MITDSIEAVDDITGRGVPMVELKTVAGVCYYTDSAGLAAIDDPVLMGRETFFYVSSHGYEFPKDGFGFRGDRLVLKPGGSARWKIKRINIAERLYRVTGEGIYRDSVMLGRPVPIHQPLLNAQVTGQDSVQALVYSGRIHWFYGDTMRPSYPLGHFWTSGAISDLPRAGGLDPSIGVNLEYFKDADGFSRGVLPRVEGTPCWLDGLMVLPDENGAERLVGTCSLMKDLGQCIGRRLVIFDDPRGMFEMLKDIPLGAPCYPVGHPFKCLEGKTTYYYFGDEYPNVRVKADLKSIQDLSAYEAFTCLAAGARYEKENSRLNLDKNGRPVWAWQRDTAAVTRSNISDLLSTGRLKLRDLWFVPTDADGRKPVALANGSVSYNAYRDKWIGIGCELGGSSSVLGEIWYCEADKPEGRWRWARKIVTHDRYSLYNPVQHPFFEQEGGRLLYFEGTYATSFSRDSESTPRYDYNQIMYRLDLADPRLKLPDEAPPVATTLPSSWRSPVEP